MSIGRGLGDVSGKMSSFETVLETDDDEEKPTLGNCVAIGYRTNVPSNIVRHHKMCSHALATAYLVSRMVRIRQSPIDKHSTHCSKHEATGSFQSHT